MTTPLILDEKKLKRIPPLFTFILILVLGLPAIAMHYFGWSSGAFPYHISNLASIDPLQLEIQIRGYFRQTLLQWSAFSLAAVTVLLAFTQYRLTQDKVALIIGLSILFSGSVDALHTLIIDGFAPLDIDKKNLDAIIWTFTNSISGLIFVIGLILLISPIEKKTMRLSTFILLSALIVLIAFTLIYYAASRMNLPEMWFEYSVITRPYELIYLFIYLFIVLFLYPRAYKKHPYILTNCIFYMSVTQIVMAIYFMLLSDKPYDSAFHIAYFLKIVTYFIPFSCLIINYVFSYHAVLEAQGKLKISEGKLKYIAAHDALTNLYNRREFKDLLDKKIAEGERLGRSFALFVMDVDNFKSINDTLGHIQGDIFLKKFSAQLTALTRKGDLLSRIGGDEFTLISSKLNSPAEARKLAERIINGLNIAYPVGGKLITATVSIGIAIYPIDGTTSEALLKNADIAMYSAKKSGKNTYHFYTEELSRIQKREAEIESHLRQALKNNELYLNFQPKYNLLTREIIGAEILLRWNNATLGEVSPYEFIPIAENTGLVCDIGHWVINKTCRYADFWEKKYNRKLLFSVNISPIQFESKNFFTDLKKIIKRYQFAAEYLDIEITEALLMKNQTEIIDRLYQIADLGISISVDDYGMGYSSLRRIKSLPIKTLKIDKAFVADIHNLDDKVIVIDTIIKLAHELGMNTAAEGIETETQLEYLVSKQCYVGQGFFLSKPLTAKKFASLAYERGQS
ncbi:putative bifunctional diguanylate cyclase/phosphodiesterase [Legionella londiniensis]|uniref:Sensory box protein n=1 Tax=Legionella londiniensis TaxID=45068 RepID=A0A0W0VR79_9GAMM|nr:EAL domain-containing protein [Legionella londiniensis]KTD22549.1 sensory box protein [Legionella londiniensis]STX92480.1 sensory box protein [Legionella londiniensis]